MNAAAATLITPALRRDRAALHDQVCIDPTLTVGEKLVFGHFLRRCYATGTVRGFAERFAGELAMPRSTFDRYCAGLRSRGLLFCRRTGRENVWSITPIPATRDSSPARNQIPHDQGIAKENARAAFVTEIPRETTTPVVVPPEVEEIAERLKAHDVPARKAEQLAKSIPVDEARAAIAAADEYAKRVVEGIDNQAGLYIAAIRNGWKAKRTSRPRAAEMPVHDRGAGESYDGYRERCSRTGETPADFEEWLNSLQN